MKVIANGIMMNYEMKGQGPDLILIHGAGDNLNMWYHQVPVFSKQYRVITYDVRGSGNTDSPEGEYSLSLFAEDVYELMKTIGVAQGCFLGYSMGGRIALELAVKHPSMVKGLVLANTPIMVVRTPPTDSKRPPLMPGLGLGGDMKTFAEMMATTAFSPGFRSKSPAEFERYMNVKLQNKPEGISRLMRSLGGLAKPPEISKLKCPVLIIVGENDALISVKRGIQAREAIPGSELVVLPSGHAAAVEAPEQFNKAVLDFMAKI
jgi:3-oxoadipate enol-lactonase